MEEFNEIFYFQLTDDQNFLTIARNHFSEFLNDPNNGILTTPLKNKQSPFLEEEKSTLDTNVNNKYSNILSESEVSPYEVNIQPFNKINDAIEEEENDEKDEKQQKYNEKNSNFEQNGRNSENGKNGENSENDKNSKNDKNNKNIKNSKNDKSNEDGHMEIDNDVISHLLSNGKI